MQQYYKIGDRELIKPVDIPYGTQKILNEMLAQNRIILESNCYSIKMINTTTVYVDSDEVAIKKPGKET